MAVVDASPEPVLLDAVGAADDGPRAVVVDDAAPRAGPRVDQHHHAMRSAVLDERVLLRNSRELPDIEPRGIADPVLDDRLHEADRVRLVAFAEFERVQFDNERIEHCEPAGHRTSLLATER